MHLQYEPGVLVNEGRRAGNELEGHDPERIEVHEMGFAPRYARVDGLGRHVERRPIQQGVGSLGALGLEDAEVHEDHAVVGGDHDICGFDVAMRHPGFVNRGEAVGDARQDVDDLVDPGGAFPIEAAAIEARARAGSRRGSGPASRCSQGRRHVRFRTTLHVMLG